jgi:hypothetical protein
MVGVLVSVAVVVDIVSVVAVVVTTSVMFVDVLVVTITDVVASNARKVINCLRPLGRYRRVEQCSRTTSISSNLPRAYGHALTAQTL